MTNTVYDALIWGPSLDGIKKAVELKTLGQRVILTGKFGFPGGKASEALASLFSIDYFKDDGLLSYFLNEVEKIKYGVLFRNNQWILIHPEAVKRVCWQLINEHELEVLFHIIPLKVEIDGVVSLEVFGREGKFTLQAQQILKMSDDGYLKLKSENSPARTMIINSFFSNPLPAEFPGFNIIRKIETPIGQYVSISIKNIQDTEIEQTFNRELDRLSKASWKKHGARILMIPVYPEF